MSIRRRNVNNRLARDLQYERVDCGGKWCAHNASSREYDSLSGVGADPNVCVAPGNGLSGQRRYKSASHDSTGEATK